MKRLHFLLLVVFSLFLWSCDNNDIGLEGEKLEALEGGWYAHYAPLIKSGGIMDDTPISATGGTRDDSRRVEERLILTDKGGYSETTYHSKVTGGWRTYNTKRVEIKDWSYNAGTLQMLIEISTGSGNKKEDYVWKRRIKEIDDNSFYVAAIGDYFTRK